MNVTDAIARQVGLPLNVAERSWLRALKDGAEMVAAVAQGSLDSKAPIAVSHEMVGISLATLAQLGDAGRAYAGLHDQLSAIARKAGLEPSMYGQSVVPAPSLAEQTVIEFARRIEAA